MSEFNRANDFWRFFESKIWRKFIPKEGFFTPFNRWRLLCQLGSPFNALFNPIEVEEEDEHQIVFRVIVPGVPRDRITLGGVQGEIMIKIHPSEDEGQDAKPEILRRDISDNVDVTNMSASLKLGILRIVAPKTEQRYEKTNIE